MATSRLVSRLMVGSSLGLGLLLTACPAPEDTGQSDTGPAEESGEEPETDTEELPDTDTIDPTVVDPTNDTATDTEADPTDTENPTESDTVDFIVPPDGGPANECDIWAQDCPEGEKCMPWDNSGGSSWNATRCSPIAADPGQPGDPCTVEGSGVSGIDDCDISAMCWNVQDNNMGVCVGFCEGSENNPVCPDPDEGCSITNDGVLILCIAKCDALQQDCPDGEACYPEPNGFFCSPDASAGAGVYGEACEYINVCAPGLFCADAVGVPGCDAVGCCSPFCDLDEPPDCPGAGQECVPFYDKGQAPPGYESHGGCLIPQ